MNASWPVQPEGYLHTLAEYQEKQECAILIYPRYTVLP